MAAESTRRFTKNLLKPGTAAEIRQTASNAVRHAAVTVSGTRVDCGNMVGCVGGKKRKKKRITHTCGPKVSFLV